MTGEEALVELVINGKKIRMCSWPSHGYIHIQDGHIVDESGARFSVADFEWATSSWSLFVPPARLEDLFSLLGPGKYAESKDFPGARFYLSPGGCIYSNAGSGIGLSRRFLNASFTIHNEVFS